MKRMLGLVGVSLLWSALAAAEPKTADEWYKEGENQYNLGDFDKAADAFKQGFSLETDDAKKPAFLYNVAQAYRQGNKCKDAVFFYKRFLSLKDTGVGKPLSDDKHKEIEGLINELDACAKTQDAIAKKPPENTMSPSGDTTGTSPGTPNGNTGNTTGTGTKVANAGDEGGEEGDEGGVRKGVTVEPKLVTGRLGLGASFVSAGNLDIPVQPNFTLIGGYPIKLIPKLRGEPGIAIAYKPIPFKNAMGGSETAAMTQLLLNASATYEVMPKISARGDLGLGLLFLSGVDMGSPFTQSGAGTSGALAMFSFRFALSGEYDVTKNIFATVTPFAYSWSPAKTGLRSDIAAINSFDFLVGAGYRM